MNFRLLLMQLCCVLLLAACTKNSNLEAAKEGSSETQITQYGAKLQGASGQLPDQSVNVCPTIAGKIQNVYVLKGQKVKKGELLVKLEDRLIDDELQQADAFCQTADVNLAQSKSAVRIARVNVELQNHIVQFKETARNDLLSAQNQLRLSEQREASAQEVVRLAKVRRVQIQAQMNCTEIRAPIDGVVAARFLNNGDRTDETKPVVQLVGFAKLFNHPR